MPTAPQPTIDDLRHFLDTSPSPFHGAATAAARLTAAGFSEIGLTDSWDELPDAGYVVRDPGAIHIGYAVLST